MFSLHFLMIQTMFKNKKKIRESVKHPPPLRENSLIFFIFLLNPSLMEDLVQNDFEDLDPSLKSLHLLQGKFVIIPIKMREIQSVAILTVGEGIVFHFIKKPPKDDLEELLRFGVVNYMEELYGSLFHFPRCTC